MYNGIDNYYCIMKSNIQIISMARLQLSARAKTDNGYYIHYVAWLLVIPTDIYRKIWSF